MPVQLPWSIGLRRPDAERSGRFGKWRVEMIEVMRSGAIIMMGLSVMVAAVAVMIYG